MKLKKIILVAFVCSLLISCSQQKTNTGNIEKIDFTDTKIEETIDITNNFNCKPIILETKKNCLIGQIDKVIVKNGRIYIFDPNVSKCLFVFNIKGDFLFKISPYGQGPGEALSLSDFDIYKENIFILSPCDRKILNYDINGHFKKEIRLKNYGNTNLKVFSEKLFMTSCCNSGTAVDFWNGKGKNIKSYDSKTLPKHINRGTLKELSVLKDSVFIQIPYNDTIFSITKNKILTSSFYFDFGKKHFPIEMFKTEKLVNMESLKDKYDFLASMAISENYIFCLLKRGKLATYFFYNRKTHEKKETKRLFYNGLMLFSIRGDYPNGLIFVSDSPILYNCVNKAEKYKGTNKKILNINPEDNPVIFIVTEKNNKEVK